MKETSFQAFEKACNYYEEGKALIFEWLTMANDVAQETFFDAMREYDYILQIILLHVALSDGYFFECEQLFIRNITEFADLLAGVKLAKGAGEKEMHWHDIEDLSAEDKAMCAQELLLYLDAYVNHFVVLFAAIDKANPNRNVLKEFKDNVMSIVLNLAVVDGDIYDSENVAKEFATGYRLFETCIEQKWMAIRE